MSNRDVNGRFLAQAGGHRLGLEALNRACICCMHMHVGCHIGDRRCVAAGCRLPDGHGEPSLSGGRSGGGGAAARRGVVNVDGHDAAPLVPAAGKAGGVRRVGGGRGSFAGGCSTCGRV